MLSFCMYRFFFHVRPPFVCYHRVNKLKWILTPSLASSLWLYCKVLFAQLCMNVYDCIALLWSPFWTACTKSGPKNWKSHSKKTRDFPDFHTCLRYHVVSLMPKWTKSAVLWCIPFHLPCVVRSSAVFIIGRGRTQGLVLNFAWL